MADIKIKQTKKRGYGMETVLELTEVDYVTDDLMKILLSAIQSQPKTEVSCMDQRKVSQISDKLVQRANMRKIVPTDISPTELKEAIKNGRGPEVIAPFDEIDITTDTGDQITAVCGYVDNKMARFVFKDCLYNAVMNEETTNKGGYFKSKGRAHVIANILPHITQEWRDILKPRQMVEIIDGEKVKYEDILWLPSATDIFGLSEHECWKDIDDSFQLEILKRERDRIKGFGNNDSACSWWLRSVYATGATAFCHVSTGGRSRSRSADRSLGLAPGFDI